jgi:hypothetical protein
MNRESNLVAPRPLVTLTAALGATIVALGILGAVATLFQSRGVPLQTLAAAERACADQLYLSDRQACIARRVADSQKTTIAAH